MKILHICLCGPYNDDWNYQENALSKYHKKLGHEVTILATPFINDKKSTGYIFFGTDNYKDSNDIRIIRLPLLLSKNSKISKRFRLYSGLFKTLMSEKPDIIFIHGLQFLDIRQIVKYKKNRPDIRIFVDGHEDYRNSARNWLSKNILHGIIWKYCAHLIEPYTEKFWGVLPARVDFLINMYNIPKEKVDLLVMGAEDEKVNFFGSERWMEHVLDINHINKDDFLIITGGKIDSNKPQTLSLMKAVNDLEHNKIKLLVFGSISNELEEEFNSLISDKIKYIGWLSADEIYQYFNAADLIVFPGLHSVLWEQAVGQGKPCVFKYIEGFTHIDLGGNCKFLYRDSIEEIKQVIGLIVNNKEQYKKMKNIAEEKGIKEFSYRKIALKSIEPLGREGV